MSLTPIFDAVLADAPVNIWEASAIFPRPVSKVFTFERPDLIGWADSLLPLQPDYTDWTVIKLRSIA